MDDKTVIAIWKCLTAVAVTLIITIGGCAAYKNKLFFENGYTYQSLPGQSYPCETKATK